MPFTHGAVLKFSLVQNHGGDNSDDNQTHNLGRFRLSVSTSTNAVADPCPPRFGTSLTRVPREQRTPAQIATVFSYWRTTVPDFKETNDKIESLWRQWPRGPRPQRSSHGAIRGPGDEMRTTFTLKRGDWLKPSKEVRPGVPAFLNPLPENADDTRLTFARWLVDRKAPPPPRGREPNLAGLLRHRIARNPEDFGLQAPAPRIRNSSTGSPASSWTPAGARRRCTASSSIPTPIAKAARLLRILMSATGTTVCCPADRDSALKARSSGTSPFPPAGF